MSADDFASLPTRRITWLYIFALSLVALLTLTGQVLVQWSLSALQGDSTTVNIAGRQRMLSQRIPRLILALDSAGDGSEQLRVEHREKVVDDLENSLNVWRNNHQGLVNGSRAVGLSRTNSQSISELFSRIEIHFESLEQIALTAIRRLRDADIQIISGFERAAMLDHSDAFLASMDEIVAQYERESKQRVSRLQWTERGLLIATLIVLLCEGIFIFSPAVASLKHVFQKLKAISKQLELAKQSAEQANLAKTQFLTQVNHELRTPLHAIIGMLDLMRRGRLTLRQKKRVDLAYHASNDLRHLVDDLLDISSVENRIPLTMHLERTHIAKTVRDCVDLMQQHAKRKELNLHVINELPDSFECMVDSYRIRQILINLFQNAIRYTTIGDIECRVWLDSDRQFQEVSNGDWLNISVRDSGCGIAPENLDRIFQNFVRINPQGTSQAFGPRLGLGLPITASLVAAMDGKISVESVVGQGSRFLIRLPVVAVDSSVPQDTLFSEQQPSESNVRKELTVPAMPHRISALVVDDSKVNRKLLREYLSKIGIKTLSTNSVSRAMRIYKADTPPLVILDLHLGNQTTFDLARSIRSTQGGASALLFFITADNQLKLDNCPEELKVSDILRKPIEFEEFRAALMPALQIIEIGKADIDGADTIGFEELRSQLKRMVRQQLPNDWRQMHEAFYGKDLKTVQLIAHRIRGSASNAGMNEIAEICAKIELNPTTLKDHAEAIEFLVRVE